MRLKDDFYTIRSCKAVAGGQAAQYHVVLNAGHRIYRAHFPGQPVTPGVCIIQMARELIELNTGRPLAVSSIKTAKFLSIVNPVDTPELQFDVTLSGSGGDAADCIGAKVEAGWNGTVFAKLSLECRTPLSLMAAETPSTPIMLSE